MFIGRTDVEVEAPILWPSDAKNLLIGKDPDARKDWRQEEKETTEGEMIGWHHGHDGHEFEQALGFGDGGEVWYAAVHGVIKSWTWLSDWTEFNWSVQNHSLYFMNSPVIYLSHALSYFSGVCPIIIFFQRSVFGKFESLLLSIIFFSQVIVMLVTRDVQLLLKRF